MMRLIWISAAITVLLGGWFAAIELLDLFENSPQFQYAIETTTIIAFSIFLCLALSTAILDFVFPTFFYYYPSGLTRTIVIVLVVFAVSVIALRQLGFDVSAIFTTSAILGAIIGLALQPTLGSLVAGIALSSDRVLSKGALIEFENHVLRVEATHWRHVYAQRADGAGVIIPNSKLAQAVLAIFPEETSTRFDTFMHLPAEVPPQLVTTLLVGAFSDVDRFDSTMPVKITPWLTHPETSSIEYRVRLYARNYDDIFDLKGEVIRRSWYVLKRNGISQPRNKLYGAESWQQGEYLDLLSSIIKMPSASISYYRFGPQESLNLPEAEFGRIAVILEGDVVSGGNQFLNPMEFGMSSIPYLAPMPVEVMAESALIRLVSDRLAEVLGPVSEKLMHLGIQNCANKEELLEYLANEIEDEKLKAKFVDQVEGLFKHHQQLPVGTTVELARIATGEVTIGLGWQSATEVVLATVDKSEILSS